MTRSKDPEHEALRKQLLRLLLHEPHALAVLESEADDPMVRQVLRDCAHALSVLTSAQAPPPRAPRTKRQKPQ